MAGTLKVLTGGTATTLQDAGRHGYRSLSVALSGALDPLWLACANALVGNPADAAGLEIRILGAGLEVTHESLCVALAGSAEVRIIRSNQNSSPLLARRSLTLEAGDTLHIGAIRSGMAYLAVCGGIDVPKHLDSRSTYARAKIGGIDGRALRSWDILPDGNTDNARATALVHPLTHTHGFEHATGAIRVLPSPQDDYFTAEVLAVCVSTVYFVTRDLDRIGIRLSSERLTHNPTKGAENVSDGVTPGMQLHFATVTRAQAHTALQAQVAALRAWIAGLVPHRPTGWINEAALYGDNLISGMVDAGVSET